MGTLSHTIMPTVFVDSLEYILCFLTYIFYKSHNARAYYILLCIFLKERVLSIKNLPVLSYCGTSLASPGR